MVVVNCLCNTLDRLMKETLDALMQAALWHSVSVFFFVCCDFRLAFNESFQKECVQTIAPTEVRKILVIPQCQHHHSGLCDTQRNCYCDPGYTGLDCSQVLSCPGDCGGPERGSCVVGECHCNPAY